MLRFVISVMLFLTAFVCLPASAQPFHLAVAHYAFDEMPAHLLRQSNKIGQGR
ncbi:hypothetical protein [Prevotella falsenii]|uniref:hypothetical protein n=1 Tax=Prevotella falsenii TaxID=515414 RepID=UPI0012EBE39F|nr:hypothetical protein [Prevotella falsenii]